MNARTCLHVMLAILCAGVGGALLAWRSASAVEKPGASLEDFAIVWENNIFDPSRRAGMVANGEGGPAPVPSPDSLALLGTMISPAERRAIFGGSQPDFRTTGTEGDAIGGFTLKEVRIGGVQVQRDGRELFLPVGKAIELQPTGEWSLSQVTIISPAIAAPPHNEPEAGPKKESDESPAQTDVLEALRQRRKKELKR